ncbi:MAG: helix-turn-helix domain-containing protein [Actinomycetota bacterium]
MEDAGGEHQTLRKLGLAEEEAEAYLALVRSDLSAPELSEVTGWEAARSRSMLRKLHGRGLARRLPGGARYRLTPPDAALSELIDEQDAELRRLRGAVRLIAESHQEATWRPGGPEPDSYLEVVGGLEALRNQFEALQAEARHEIVGCTKLPILVTPIESGNVGEEEALSRGVSNRWIYERAVLELPGALEGIRRYAERGEQSRIIDTLPSKFTIVDRRVALIHVTEQTPAGQEILGLIMRHPELVGALDQFFELLWDTATPIQDASEAGSSETRRRPMAELVDYMAAGLTDATVARQLGITDRTLRRWMQELLLSLGAQSRFEAGFKLGRETARGQSSR